MGNCVEREREHVVLCAWCDSRKPLDRQLRYGRLDKSFCSPYCWSAYLKAVSEKGPRGTKEGHCGTAHLPESVRGGGHIGS